MKAAIYLRVSTARQDETNQEPACAELARARGWEPTVFREVGSGAVERPTWRHVIELARLGQVRAVVVWSIDRVGRRMHEVVADVRELDRVGCAVVSVREPWLDTSGPTRDLLLAIFAWVAAFERERLRERTVAGVERARAAGKRLGRPPAELDMGRLLKWAARGVPLNRIARRLGVSWDTVNRRLSEIPPPPPPPEVAQTRHLRDTI